MTFTTSSGANNAPKVPQLTQSRANYYEITYYQLLELMAPDVKSKILAAVRLPHQTDEISMTRLDPDVKHFIESVTRLAEQRYDRQSEG